MITENCEVTVLCVTYNQVSYLRKALDSILSQETNFGYEVIVHDDVSNDGTLEIIKEYERKYPGVIRLIIETENQYSKGIDFIAPIIRNYACGKYIALCEGDDFWIDNKKLQIQRDAMLENPNCDMCACWGCTVTEDGKNEVSQIRPINHDGILSTEEVILGGGQYLVSAGLFFKKSMYDDLYGMDSLDYSLQIRGSIKGGIYYIDRKMAVYRRYSKGSWTNAVLKKSDVLEKQWEKEKYLLSTFDRYTDYSFHDVIEERLKSYTTFDSQLETFTDEIHDILSQSVHPIIIWGMGRRGVSLERYLKNNSFQIDGICDAINEHIGEKTPLGTPIVSTNMALTNGKTILASNNYAYEYIIGEKPIGKVIACQKYMPYG